ncbi:holin [Lactococcus petauri]|uniref:Holin n=1 Tax=Lactococcus garvieae TaxID=1363 RepID=A0A6L2ZSW6_9LACT|nr:MULTISPECIES: holin [Lactococcus]KKF91534.1 holin [Lactococcus garvieae]MCH1714050.1 holin [Lactococcus petauri]MDG6136990.1 holin [Lactococcus petauri]MDT2553050.1 holin [Lactococcus petauri]MDT2563559.1 holin [Lactococcus petauri]
MFTKTFLKDILERAVKTFAQSMVAVMTAGATGILDVDWINALSVSLLATIVSVLTSIGSGTVGDQSASVINLNKENK